MLIFLLLQYYRKISLILTGLFVCFQKNMFFYKYLCNIKTLNFKHFIFFALVPPSNYHRYTNRTAKGSQSLCINPINFFSGYKSK